MQRSRWGRSVSLTVIFSIIIAELLPRANSQPLPDFLTSYIAPISAEQSSHSSGSASLVGYPKAAAPAPGLSLAPALSFQNNQSNPQLLGVFRIVGSNVVPFSEQGEP